MELDSELEYLSLVEESDGYHESRAVFSGLDTGIEVKQYSNFELYEWHCNTEFSELIGCVEPLYPFVEDPALEMLKEEGRVRDADRDHETISNELVYDPVREWRNEQNNEEGRWDKYSLIQLNLDGAKLVWDQKDSVSQSRIRVYAIDQGSEIATDIFLELVDEEDADGLVEDISKAF